jgi:hypothetical protein
MIAQQDILFIAINCYTIFCHPKDAGLMMAAPPAEASGTRVRLGNGAVKH